MFWTQGYADYKTYSAEEHILSGAVICQGMCLYVWIVSEKALEQEKRDVLQKALQEWIIRIHMAFSQEKEALCYKESSRLLAGKEGLQLYVSYAHLLLLYRYDTKSRKVLQTKIQSKQNKEQNFFMYTSQNMQLFLDKAADCQRAEEAANILKYQMLCEISEQKIESGYFFIWEQ